MRLAKGHRTPDGLLKVPAYLNDEQLNAINSIATQNGETFSAAMRRALSTGLNLEPVADDFSINNRLLAAAEHNPEIRDLLQEASSTIDSYRQTVSSMREVFMSIADRAERQCNGR